MHFPIPKTNNMPDISTLYKPVILNAIQNMVFGRRGPSGYPAIAFHSGFIRNVDKTIFEYGFARECLEKAIAKNQRWTNYLMCLAHLETCINSINRAVAFLDRLKRCLRAPLAERKIRKFIERHSKNIGKIRDTIEHIDEHIQKGIIQKGNPLGLVITNDEKSIQISCYRITFYNLALVIRNLHTIAENLAKYDEGS